MFSSLFQRNEQKILPTRASKTWAVRDDGLTRPESRTILSPCQLDLEVVTS